ncbi:MAG: hypothetical protein KTR18_08450 [Acidiferrobacterales bacterium]|nr:hypothetical protein [Acidiferrobacterales bacterium]
MKLISRALLGFVVWMLIPLQMHAHTATRFLEANLSVPDKGETGLVQAELTVTNVWNKPLVLEILPARENFGRRLSAAERKQIERRIRERITPKQQQEISLVLNFSEGPKIRMPVEIRILSESGTLLGKQIVYAYATLKGNDWERRSYEELYLPQKASTRSGSYWKVPGVLLPDGKQDSESRTREKPGTGRVPVAPGIGTPGTIPTVPLIRGNDTSMLIQQNRGKSWMEAVLDVIASRKAHAQVTNTNVSGTFSVLDLSGTSRPGADWSVYISNITTNQEYGPVVTSSTGRWSTPVEAADTDALRITYRPANNYIKVRPEMTDSYALSTGVLFSVGGATPNEQIDFSSATGVFPGMVELMNAAFTYRTTLGDAGLPPERAVPITVYFPNTWYDCGTGSPWSCARPNGEMWLISQHGATPSVTMHELSHQIDYEYHNNARPAGAGGPHAIDTCYNPGLALSEGFADALPDFVLLGSGGANPGIESPDKVSICNGDTNETWVRAAFWDLLDTTDDDLDQFEYVDGAEPFRIYLEGPMYDGIRDYLNDFRAASGDPALVNNVFDNNTITVGFTLPGDGGDGGNPYHITCAPGSYLIGIRGRAAVFIDRLQGICADVNGVETQTERTGGDGGNAWARRCPDGKLVSGLTGRAGAFIDQLSIECRSPSGNTLLNDPELSATAGGTGGEPFSIQRCPVGMAGVGFEGQSAGFVDQVALVCDELDWTALDHWDSPVVGGPGGTGFKFDCPADEALVGIEIRSGWWIDAIRPFCATVNGTNTGEVIGATEFVGGDGGILDSRICQEGSVMNGLLGKSGAYIDSLRLECLDLASADIDNIGVLGGTGGGSFQPIRCPEGLFPKSLRGRADGYLDALSISCADITSGPARGPWISPAEGGNGGDAFSSICDSNQVLAGIRVRSGFWLDRIQARCVNVSAGQWVDTPASRTGNGGTGGSPAVTQDCPEDHAVSGIRGNAAAYVDRIRVRCRALTAANRLDPTDNNSNGGPFIGGTGGTPFAHNCPADMPATGIRGRAAGYVDQIRIRCSNP